jgi:hypothetical protein
MPKQHSEKTKNKISNSLKGHLGYFKGKHLSNETCKKMSIARKGIKFSEEHRKNLQKSHLGQNKGKTYNWKGGITSENNRIRTGIETRLWREAVFARDNFTCQKCKIKGNYLTPHHIQNFSQFIELRFAIDNGITFCINCHKEFHKKYGRQNNNKQQINEFI